MNHHYSMILVSVERKLNPLETHALQTLDSVLAALANLPADAVLGVATAGLVNFFEDHLKLKILYQSKEDRQAPLAPVPVSPPWGSKATPKKSAVDHPGHYGGKDNPYEAIKVIEAWGPLANSFCVGSALKYICRAGKKTDPASQDLRKAAWYLSHQADMEEKDERRRKDDPDESSLE